jgi:hypothetical protein
MKRENKLRGGSKSELTRLKALAPAERAEIHSWQAPAPGTALVPTNADIRKRIKDRFGIKLSNDGQLSEFWSWQFRQAPIDHLGLMMSQDEQLLQDQFPDKTREQIREAVIKRSYAMTDMMGDVKTGLKVLAADLKDSHERRDWEKWREGLRSKLESGLDAVAEGFKKNAEAMKFYQKAREMISRETK